MNKFLCFTFLREGVESLYHARLVTKFIKIRLIDEINQAEPVEDFIAGVGDNGSLSAPNFT